MAFAVFYNDEDAAVIGGNLTRTDLTQSEKTTAQKIWNGGFKNWATAPLALSPTCDDPNTLPVTSRRIVVSAAAITKQSLVDLLNSIGARLGQPDGGYLLALAADVQQCAVEPYP